LFDTLHEASVVGLRDAAGGRCSGSRIGSHNRLRSLSRCFSRQCPVDI
jgi:hypothetical protein